MHSMFLELAYVEFNNYAFLLSYLFISAPNSLKRNKSSFIVSILIMHAQDMLYSHLTGC